ncbi:YqjF family protein [Lysinibacillus sp. 54212]|uniref:YqjF family protein n=1 Tax=Lysinibacillus sp. 54212 TaxID=3119829 RepID=UPI002FCB998A
MLGNLTRGYKHRLSFPKFPWVLQQNWHNVLFVHYPVYSKSLQKFVPRSLELDTFNGMCWVSIVLFIVKKNRIRLLPLIPGTNQFIQMNVRTYVTLDGTPGVYFLSIDASNKVAVTLATTLFFLPNYDAVMNLQQEGSSIFFQSARKGKVSLEMECCYKPISPVFYATKNSLEAWLIERYTLFSLNRNGQPVRGDIYHAPWQLQHVEATVYKNTMLTDLSIAAEYNEPIFHFSKMQQARICPLVSV